MPLCTLTIKELGLTNEDLAEVVLSQEKLNSTNPEESRRALNFLLCFVNQLRLSKQHKRNIRLCFTRFHSHTDKNKTTPDFHVNKLDFSINEHSGHSIKVELTNNNEKNERKNGTKNDHKKDQHKDCTEKTTYHPTNITKDDQGHKNQHGTEERIIYKIYAKERKYGKEDHLFYQNNNQEIFFP